MFILKKGHQPGVYMPLRALFLDFIKSICHVHMNVFAKCDEIL